MIKNKWKKTTGAKKTRNRDKKKKGRRGYNVEKLGQSKKVFAKLWWVNITAAICSRCFNKVTKQKNKYNLVYYCFKTFSTNECTKEKYSFLKPLFPVFSLEK